MATPTFPSGQTSTAPASVAITYDHWALCSFQASGTGIGADKASASYQFALAGFDANGMEVLHPTARAAQITIPDVYALVAQEPLIGVAMQMLLAGLEFDAVNRGIGIIDAPAGHLTALLNTVVAELQAIIPSLNGA